MNIADLDRIVGAFPETAISLGIALYLLAGVPLARWAYRCDNGKEAGPISLVALVFWPIAFFIWAIVVGNAPKK